GSGDVGAAAGATGKVDEVQPCRVDDVLAVIVVGVSVVGVGIVVVLDGDGPVADTDDECDVAEATRAVDARRELRDRADRRRTVARPAQAGRVAGRGCGVAEPAAVPAVGEVGDADVVPDAPGHERGALAGLEAPSVGDVNGTVRVRVVVGAGGGVRRRGG